MAAVLRCFRLGEQSLWIDEVFTWYNAAIGKPLGWTDLIENVHGPLHALLLHMWGHFAGDGEWALRLPSALFGAAMVPAMAWLAGRWLGRDTVIPAVWLTACSPFLVWYGQEARNYSPLMFFTVLSAALLLEARERPRPANVLGYLAASAAGLLSNLSFTFLAPLHLRWWLTGLRPRRAQLGSLVVVALGLTLIVAPWLQQATRVWDWDRLHATRDAASSESALRGLTTFHAAALPFAAHTFSVGYTLGPSLRELRTDASWAMLRRHAGVLVTVALLFGLLGIAGLREMHRRKRLLETLIWLAVPALLVSYAALQNFKVFHPRYLAVAMPAVLLVFAAGFAAMRPRVRWAAGVAVALLWGMSLWNHWFVPAYGKEDFRSAAALISEQGAEGEQVLAVNSIDMLDYYYRGSLPVHSFWLGFARNPIELRSKLAQALSGTDSTAASWVVVSRPQDLDPTGQFEKIMYEKYPNSQRNTFEGVTVWHVHARPATDREN